jgi:hypothetical protein
MEQHLQMARAAQGLERHGERKGSLVAGHAKPGRKEAPARVN